MGSLYKQQLNDWVSSLDVKGEFVLDIGGSQNPIKGRTNSWEVAEYKVVDLEHPHVTKQPPDIIQDMNEPIDVNNAKYYERSDLVFCLGVFDYVINPNIAMENLYALLRFGGVAWVEFPLFYAHHEPLMDEGCRYSEGCIYRLAKQANLRITEMIRKPAGNPHLVRFFQEDRQRMARDYKYHDTVGFIVRFEK